MMEKKKRLSHGKIVHYIINALLVLGTLTVLFPLYMTVIIAFKKPSEMTNDISGALSLPSSWNLDNFVEAIKITDFWHTLGNSLLITCVTVVLCILLHANRFGVIVLYTVFFMPMNLMLYAGYLKNIPTALEEAAHVDGASAFKIFWKIIFPNMKPMHATVAILTAMSTWNDVTTPLVILSGTDHNTLPIAQLNFQSQFGTNYNLAFASYLLALLPILLFYVVCQKQIMNGVVNGAVK